jgi:hypothetical protein
VIIIRVTGILKEIQLIVLVTKLGSISRLGGGGCGDLDMFWNWDRGGSTEGSRELFGGILPLQFLFFRLLERPPPLEVLEHGFFVEDHIPEDTEFASIREIVLVGGGVNVVANHHSLDDVGCELLAGGRSKIG